MGDAFDTQVAIVGGGPAGAALQIRLARAGVESVLFERAPRVHWRACGVFSSPLTRGRLRDLGVSDGEISRLARPISALEVRTQAGAAVRLEYGTAAGYACGFDRVALDALLLDKARAAGAVKTASVVTSIGLPVRSGAPVRLTVAPTEGVIGSAQQWRARLVVGADGPRSLVARSAGVTTLARLLCKAGLTFHESDPLAEADGRAMVGQFLLGNGWYVGVAPVPDARVNVGIVIPAEQLGAPLNQVIGRTRGLMRDRSGIPISMPSIDEMMVALPLRHRVWRAAGPGFLLVGDAAGFIDPLTGEGLHRALVSAELGADAITRWLRGDAQALDDYDRHLRGRFRTKDIVSWVLQAFLAQPALLDYALRRLASRRPQREVLTLVLTDQLPASRGLDPRFLARLLAP